MNVLRVRPGVFTDRVAADLYELKDYLYLNGIDKLSMTYKDYKSYSRVVGGSPSFLLGIPIEVIDPPDPPEWFEGELVSQT